MNNLTLGASVSCFDLFNLKAQMEEIHSAPIDFLHYDVVDGHFNRCIILGLPLLEAIRPHTKLPIEVHLAVYEPERYIEQFVRAGADIVSIHPEGTDRLLENFALIRALGAKPALALRSETNADEALLPALDEAEYAIKLTVNPGFSGQAIQMAALEKMMALRRLMDANGIQTPIAADGNVNAGTIALLKESGAQMLIGGTSGLLLKGQSVRESANALLAALAG